MNREPTCPRCDAGLRPPGLWSSAWECSQHGPVPPYNVCVHLGPDTVAHVRKQSRVPVWTPHPLPPGWAVSGLAYSGDERSGAAATALACTGPSPIEGTVEMVLVAEEPGVGLGARLAGLAGPDPGAGFQDNPPEAKPTVDGHPTPMWGMPAPDDRAAFVGEAKGQWLWVVLWPAAAGVVMYDDLAIVDVSDLGEAAVEFGSPTHRLRNAS